MVRVRHSRQWFHARAAGLAILAVGTSLATGCKSGSWGAKPSWWSFGGSPPASALTSAPSFDKDKDIAKPSEAAKPYPTTSTPDGYALSDATKTDASRSAASPTAGLVEPTAVTYGTTPAPAAAAPQPAAATAAVAGSSMGPQVGPYASLQPQPAAAPPPAGIDPATAATAGMAAAPAFGEASPPTTQPQPAQPFASQPPAARYADASASQAWPASPPPAAPPTAAALPAAPAAAAIAPQAIDGRYGETNGSRFGTPASGFAAPAAAPQAPPVEPPAATPTPAPGAGDALLPGAITPPRRRPDAGYRPAGTSSYQPGKLILAGDQPPATGVEPASFEAPPTVE